MDLYIIIGLSCLFVGIAIGYALGAEHDPQWIDPWNDIQGPDRERRP